MIEFLLFIFMVCLLFNYIKEGGNFIFFSRAVEFANSFREQTPRSAKKQNNNIKLEYKFGKRIYSVILPRIKPIKWIEAAVLVNENWVNKTHELEHYAGPYRNFFGLPLSPNDINIGYEKIAFKFVDGTVVHVQPSESIYKKIKIANDLVSSKSDHID